MAKTTYCYIGAVDVGSAGLNILTDIEVEPVRAGVVGQGVIRLRRTSLFTANDFLPLQEVRIWTEDPTAGPAGLTERRFGGIGGRRITRTNNVRNLKRWEIPLLDYNVLGKLQGDARPGYEITLSSAKLQTQVLALITAIQAGTASRLIDTANVDDLDPGTALDAVTFSGQSLADMLDSLCAAYAARTGNTAGWHFGPDRTLGGTGLANFGNPCLYLYQTGVTPTPSYQYSDTPGGAYLSIYGGWWERELDALDVVQKRQGSYGTAGGVVTSSVPAAAAAYPNPFSADGYWWGELVHLDTPDSTTAQAALDRDVASTAYPVERVTHDVLEDVQPGQYIGETMASEGLSDYIMQVGTVKRKAARTDTPELNRRTLTLGPPVEELGDDNLPTVLRAPQIGDPTMPLAPAQPALLSNTYDGSTGLSYLTITVYHSASLNRAAHYVRYRINGGNYRWSARLPEADPPVSSEIYALPGVLPGATVEIWTQAVSGSGVWSPFSSPVLSVVAAAVDSPAPPTALTLDKNVNLSQSESVAVVTFTPSADAGIVAYYLFFLEAPAGPTRTLRVEATVPPAVKLRGLSPGLTYSLTGQAFTAYDDGGDPSSPALSIPAARWVGADKDPAPRAGQGDPDTTDPLATLGYEKAVTGSGAATVDPSVVWEGIAAWKLASGASAASAAVSTLFRKAAAPGSTWTYDFREGAAGAAEGTLELLIQPRDDTDAAVGSELVAYTAAPATAADGTPRRGQFTLPTTSTITQFSYRWRYTGDGTHARAVYCTTPQVRLSNQVEDTNFLTANGNRPLPFPDSAGVARAKIYVSDSSTGEPATANFVGAFDSGNPDPDAAHTRARVADTFGNALRLDEAGALLEDFNGNALTSDSGGLTLATGTGTGQELHLTSDADMMLAAGGNLDLTSVDPMILASDAEIDITGTGEVVIREAGDEYGASQLRILNRSGLNGAEFYADFDDHNLSLIDFIFKWNTPTGTDYRNIRVEDRSGYHFTANHPEFQIGTHDDPDVALSAGGLLVRRGLLQAQKTLLQPGADADHALTLEQHSGSQSGRLLKLLDSGGSTELYALDAWGRPIGGGSAPSGAFGTGAGTSPSGLTVTGSDAGGYVSFTTGTSPAGSATIVTITFAHAFAVAPKVIILTAGNANASQKFQTTYIDQASISTTSFQLKAGLIAAAASTAYVWGWMVLG